MEGLKRNIVIMDFSGIYQEEQFYEGEQISWIDLSDISGTNCYCDGDARRRFWNEWKNIRFPEFILLIPEIIII